MREILFDTETTGVFPDHGDEKLRDRIVEIGCVEVFNLERTGKEFHAYFNPDRDVPEEVVRVHGLRREFLINHKRFNEVAQDFLEFIGDAPLVAHNAQFDQNFVNAELRRLNLPLPANERFIDTLERAKAKLRAGMRLSLDGLSKHYRLDQRGFDLNARKGAGGHGALIDAKMLAEIYIELQGGRVQQFSFGDEPTKNAEGEAVVSTAKIRPRLSPLPLLSTAEERALHDQFNNELGGGNPWSN